MMYTGAIKKRSGKVLEIYLCSHLEYVEVAPFGFPFDPAQGFG